MQPIYFYRVNDPYGEFSNFAPFRIEIDGKSWPASEHFFQAQKFAEQSYREEIRSTVSPMNAARMGRDRKHPIRKDWEAVKDHVMYRAVRAKFEQHAELRALLLSTDDARLIEHTENDRYWADGGDGGGKNMLGVILMRVRKELREIESVPGA